MANHEAEPDETPAQSFETPVSEQPADFSDGQDFANQGSQDFGQSPVATDFSAETNYSTDQNFQQQGDFQSQDGFQQNGFEQNNVEQSADQFGSPASVYNNDSHGVGGQAVEQNFGGEQSYQDSSAEYADSADQEAPVAEAPVEEAPFDFNATLDQQPMQAPPPACVSDSADFSDVTDFANADTTAGPLTYVVIIDGIESSQLLYQLKEAMTDSRFGWDVNELLTQVGGGRLVIPGLNPAKASVLIGRIKYLPFKISWRQDVLSGS
ncbi:hypothetical protein [Bdellovibrio sp. NC01]|uniref:hypothetical protein n=1 Tax=Bdellovibrio sp. NC01 TaxID=2220073 RepID=UPI001FEF5A8E|nr:hypothetical protein [Bdellovibrio sp. NC01]